MSEPPVATTTTVKASDDLISKVSINKYDPFQLKGTVDDEICYVSTSHSPHIFAVDRDA
jgi:hypothetical protein